MVKDSRPEQLLNAIRRVHAGLRFIDPALAAESVATGKTEARTRAEAARLAEGDGWL